MQDLSPYIKLKEYILELSNHVDLDVDKIEVGEPVMQKFWNLIAISYLAPS